MPQVQKNATVQTTLEISRAVNQQYTFVTFDLAAAKKAYSIVWKNPTSDTIIH
jgi:hypothetical protein